MVNSASPFSALFFGHIVQEYGSQTLASSVDKDALEMHLKGAIYPLYILSHHIVISAFTSTMSSTSTVSDVQNRDTQHGKVDEVARHEYPKRYRNLPCIVVSSLAHLFLP